jgi:hypothetical protein
MNYKVGDTVVCIDAIPLPGMPKQLEAGKLYLVEHIGPDSMGRICVLVATELPCGWNCRITFRPERFIKLYGLKQDQTTEKGVSA